MFYQRFLVCVLIPACALVSGCGGGGGGASTSFTSPIAPQTGSLTIRLAHCGSLSKCPPESYSRYSLFIGGEYEGRQMASIRAANPDARILFYQIAAVVTDAQWAITALAETQVYSWVNENHPEWFLLDTQGRRIRFRDYPSHWVLDPGNTEYQNAFARNVIDSARRIGADGVKLDNIQYHYDWTFDPIPAKYPTIWSYAEAMTSFINNVSAQIRAAGLIVIGNGSAETCVSAPWTDWIAQLDGREYEPPGMPYEPTYEREQLWLDLFRGYTSYPDKISVKYLPDPRQVPEVFRFAVASYLLWMGPNSYAACPYTDGSVPVSHPLLDLAIGQPTGPCVKIGASAYKRTFEYGQVILNISASASEAVVVEPGYRDATRGPVAAGTVTLAPHQSLILVKQ